MPAKSSIEASIAILRTLWAAISEGQAIGLPMTFREMEMATGIRGRETILRLLRRLEQTGYVRHNPKVRGYSWTAIIPLISKSEKGGGHENYSKEAPRQRSMLRPS